MPPESPHILHSPRCASSDSHAHYTDPKSPNLHHGGIPSGSKACDPLASALQHSSPGGDDALAPAAEGHKLELGSEVDDTPLTLGEETWLVLQGVFWSIQGHSMQQLRVFCVSVSCSKPRFVVHKAWNLQVWMDQWWKHRKAYEILMQPPCRDVAQYSAQP